MIIINYNDNLLWIGVKQFKLFNNTIENTDLVISCLINKNKSDSNRS